MAAQQKLRIGPLCTVGQARSELGKVYRQARRGEIDPQDLSRFCYTLKTLSDLIVLENFEQRLAELEAGAGALSHNNGQFSHAQIGH